MQARVFFSVLDGETKLPSSEKMSEDIQSKREAIRKRYVSTPRHTIQVSNSTLLTNEGRPSVLFVF